MIKKLDTKKVNTNKISTCYFLALALLTGCMPILNAHKRPRLSIIIVVDQLSYYALQKYKPFLRGGLHHLMHRGVNYSNAYHPHAIPETAPGHAALSTGCYPKDHGIVSNSWFDSAGKKITACYASPESAAVLKNSAGTASLEKLADPETGIYNYGVSSELLKVDTLSDQFMLQDLAAKPRHAYALSLKDYAATQMAGKLGKAIWLDEITGDFTSSKAYFDALPAWIADFNMDNSLRNINYVFWAQAKPLTSNGYVFAENQNLQDTDFSQGLVNTEIPLAWESKPAKPLHLYVKTPHANQRLFDLAKSCISTHLNKKNKDELLLWISLSPLDKVGHAFGPDSKETIDLIYHLDQQLQKFIRYVQKAVGKKELLWVLTADHGISPMPTTVAQKGYPAVKYSAKDLVKKLNNKLKKAGYAPRSLGLQDSDSANTDSHDTDTHNTDAAGTGTTNTGSTRNNTYNNSSNHKINTLVQHIANNQLYFNTKLFASLSSDQQENLIKSTKQLLLENPGIKRVWSYQELAHGCFDKTDLAHAYKNQLYPGRSGHLIIQMDPYCEISEWKKGADHSGPYDYNTHVPLILYQHGHVELKKIDQRVSTLQLANTLADILCIPKPSASTAEHLPGLHGRMPILLF
jgi:predicted AlkP superfamily pyrophosphatase or phosphodiesterase